MQYRVTVENSDAVRTTGQITISDQLPRAMRLKTGTIRYNGELITPVVQPNGQDFTVEAPPLPPSGSGLLTYIAEVRQDAQPGDALNLASASDDRGATSPTVDALVRVERDGIFERFTLIGRITDGGCSTDPEKASGIGGVRVILQDGTYTVTDSEGRYHFEGLKPGLHVVQVDPSTFPADLAPVDCARNTRTAGSDISRFVEGRGGALKRADFRAKTVAPREISEKYNYHKPTVSRSIPLLLTERRRARTAQSGSAPGAASKSKSGPISSWHGSSIRMARSSSNWNARFIMPAVR